jgi:hypothetical protein
VKKILLIALLLTLGKTGTAQSTSYHPFPDSNAVWKINFGQIIYCQSSGGIATNIIYTYRFSDMITLGPYRYKTFLQYMYNYVPSNCAGAGTYTDTTTLGYLREDTANKVVFFRTNAGSEVLLYDFSRSPGDTLNLNWIGATGAPHSYTCTISSIDSVLVGSIYHKRFNLSNNDKHIEGVGSTAGPVQGSQNAPMPTWPNQYWLVCFHHAADFYPTNSSSCNLDVGIQPFMIDESPLIYPNPAQQIFQITGTEITGIEAYDIWGNNVRDTRIKPASEQGIFVDCSEWKNGIYLLRLQTLNGTMLKKIIVNH